MMNINVDNLKNQMKSPRSLISYMEHSQDHWFIKDSESRYVYMNDSALKYFNVPKNFDIEGKLDSEIPLKSSQELWPDLVKHDQKVMEKNKKISAIEIHYYGKGNTDTPVPHFCDKTPLYDDNKKCIGVVCHGTELDAPALLYYMNRFNRSTIEFEVPNARFTPRELEIAFWAQQKLSSKEIAKRLNISYRTIEHRLNILYQKTHVNTLSQFIDYWQAKGLDKYIPSDFIRKGVQLVA
jgi:DNA-binding CsgD family transcriptional regulator